MNGVKGVKGVKGVIPAKARGRGKQRPYVPFENFQHLSWTAIAVCSLAAFCLGLYLGGLIMLRKMGVM
jgi:hypothetical protein